MGALVMSTSGSLWLGLSATLVLAIYCFKMTEWTAPDVERETGLRGISASPISVNALVPYIAWMDWLLDRIPGIKTINYNPERKKQTGTGSPDQLTALDMLSEPMVIGVLMGLALALAADYGLKESLELSVHIAAVMFLLPKSAGLIGEAMMPITTALREQVERHFPRRKNLVVAMDTGFLMHHKSVVVTGLLLMALAIGIALVLPGNRVLPLGDLPNVISVMSLSVLMMRGNVFRAVLAGIPVIITFLWVASSMAPAYTELAHQAPAFNVEGLGLITAFTDGGHQLRYWLYSLYQAQWWAIGVLPLIGAGIFFTRRRFIAMVK
jgi:PTS system galactitol-specific IIC component